MNGDAAHAIFGPFRSSKLEAAMPVTGITPHSSPVVSYPRASIRLRNDFLVLSIILYFVIKVPKLVPMSAESPCEKNTRKIVGSDGLLMPDAGSGPIAIAGKFVAENADFQLASTGNFGLKVTFS